MTTNNTPRDFIRSLISRDENGRIVIARCEYTVEHIHESDTFGRTCSNGHTHMLIGSDILDRPTAIFFFNADEAGAENVLAEFLRNLEVFTNGFGPHNYEYDFS